MHQSFTGTLKWFLTTSPCFRVVLSIFCSLSCPRIRCKLSVQVPCIARWFSATARPSCHFTRTYSNIITISILLVLVKVLDSSSQTCDSLAKIMSWLAGTWLSSKCVKRNLCRPIAGWRLPRVVFKLLLVLYRLQKFNFKNCKIHVNKHCKQQQKILQRNCSFRPGTFKAAPCAGYAFRCVTSNTLDFAAEWKLKSRTWERRWSRLASFKVVHHTHTHTHTHNAIT